MIPSLAAEQSEVTDYDALLALLGELLDVKQEAFGDLARAVTVAIDALRPLADNKPLSGPAQRALVTMALMSLGQAEEALEKLEVVVREVSTHSRPQRDTK